MTQTVFRNEPVWSMLSFYWRICVLYILHSNLQHQLAILNRSSRHCETQGLEWSVGLSGTESSSFSINDRSCIWESNFPKFASAGSGSEIASLVGQMADSGVISPICCIPFMLHTTKKCVISIYQVQQWQWKTARKPYVYAWIEWLKKARLCLLIKSFTVGISALSSVQKKKEKDSILTGVLGWIRRCNFEWGKYQQWIRLVCTTSYCTNLWLLYLVGFVIKLGKKTIEFFFWNRSPELGWYKIRKDWTFDIDQRCN